MANHHASICRVKISCRKCHRKQNTLLHYDQKFFQDSEDSTADANNTKISDSVCAAGFQNRVNASGSPISKVVPVNVWFNGFSKQVSTYTFIDEGSSVNFCSERCEKFRSSNHCHSCETGDQKCYISNDKRVSCIVIQGLGESSAFVVPDVFVVDEVVDVSSSIPANRMAHAFSRCNA